MGSILRPTEIAKKSQTFFINLCDAISDVTFFMYIDAILGCDIFEKKTFDSMRFLCDCHPCITLSIQRCSPSIFCDVLTFMR